MRTSNNMLLAGGCVSALAALLHVAIIFGGPDWYRFFGAGEGMAQLAGRGSWVATAITAGIAIMLALWAHYAFSGAGLVPRVPLLRVGLCAIAGVYLARGVLGIPAVLLLDRPYMNELKHHMIFMLVSSLICLITGLCYAVGAAQIWADKKD